jgi:hypothetical protein
MQAQSVPNRLGHCSWLRPAPESEESRITGLFLRGTKSLKELRTTNWFFSQNILIRLPNTVRGLGPRALLLVVGLEAGDKRRASRLGGCETGCSSLLLYGCGI